MKAPLRVVLDTNVAVALEVFGDPKLAALRGWWEAGDVAALVDDQTLAEFDRVLRYPEMRLDEPAAVAIGQRYAARCTVVPPQMHATVVLPQCRDGDDQKFLELAQRGGADWLLTRDKALLRLRKAVRFAIATPEDMMKNRRALPVQSQT
ncbi:MAG: putative toxin-antitoxin system toxin component, PIN family [Betaproteobacteria bacterium]